MSLLIMSIDKDTIFLSLVYAYGLAKKSPILSKSHSLYTLLFSKLVSNRNKICLNDINK